MDQRALKRLLIILVASIIVIWGLKSMMLKTAVSLNKVAVEKKQAAVKSPVEEQDATPVSDEENVVESLVNSGTDETNTVESSAASAVEEER